MRVTLLVGITKNGEVQTLGAGLLTSILKEKFKTITKENGFEEIRLIDDMQGLLKRKKFHDSFLNVASEQAPAEPAKKEEPKAAAKPETEKPKAKANKKGK